MNWTTAADLRAQVQKLWDKGALLTEMVTGETTFPRRLRMVLPASADLSERFDAVRSWMATLQGALPPAGATGLRVVWRDVQHRVVGSNRLPHEVWLDSLDDALAVIGKRREAQRFASLLQSTRQSHPALAAWLAKRPLQALALAQAEQGIAVGAGAVPSVWQRLLAIVTWLSHHPRPGIYLRQVSLAGVAGIDSKFIEANRAVLAELLDLALAPADIDTRASGVSRFCQRYGFKEKPLRIRFRLLMERGPGLDQDQDQDQDITLTQAAFERLALPLHRVFITENEVNFLAFPAVADSMVVFGSGYGFDVLAGAPWLQHCSVHYWGDMDTHGFAMLDQLRVYLPHAQSLLMDRATLMAHADHWGEEPQPSLRDLPRLNAAEAAVFDDLRHNRIRMGLRLEQERIEFDWLQHALAAFPPLDIRNKK